MFTKSFKVQVLKPFVKKEFTEKKNEDKYY